MDEDGVRALAREEILKAFTEMRTGAHWYLSGYGDLTESAAHVVEDTAERVIGSLTPPAPEPVNPFAPKHTAQEWADRIRELIRQAEADGYQIWCDADGSVSSTAPIAMRIGTDVSPIEEDPTVWRLQ